MQEMGTLKQIWIIIHGHLINTQLGEQMSRQEMKIMKLVQSKQKHTRLFTSYKSQKYKSMTCIHHTISQVPLSMFPIKNDIHYVRTFLPANYSSI